MSVTEVHQASGSWSIGLDKTIPQETIDILDYFGHIAIIPGRVDPELLGDGILSIARYVGVLRDRSFGDTYAISGAGMEIWLGDEDDKGDVLENKTTFTSASFANSIRGLLPEGGSITEGTIHSVPGLYNGTHQWEAPKTSITYVTDTFGADWRVNYNGTLDAGLTSDLFVTNPKCFVVRKGAGVDGDIRAIPGAMELDLDMQDYTTRVVLLAEGDGNDIATAAADISPALNPYKDLHGNTVVRTRLVSESDTAAGNAATRAQLQLNRFTSTNKSLTLGARDFDIRGDFAVGDYVWVFDPDSGLKNTANEITFRGMRINPIALRIVEATWPVTPNYTVAYRSGTGVWYNLTNYVAYESPGSTSLTVGDLDRQLTSSGFEPVGSRPNADTSVPGVPTFLTPFLGATYLDNRGYTKAQLIAAWSAPNNADGSTVQDGDHYEVRYAVDSNVIYPATWNQVSVIRWQDMQAWEQPFASPSASWNVVNVAWGVTSVRIQDLAPGIGYDFQIRAVDTTGNASAWSATTVAITTQDNLPPSQPQAPEVASSRIAIQITHRLGKASAGDYTLEGDLDHLEIHVGYSDTFFPDNSTLVGKLKANAGMIAALVPAVGTYQVEETFEVHVKVVAVDITGNKSIPSAAATATAELIDDAHISSLTVSKVTAGTIGADFIVGSRIKTADTGARVELNSSGLQAYGNDGTQTINVSSVDGSVSIVGQFKTGTSARRVEIGTDLFNPSIKLYDDQSGSDYSMISTTGLASTAHLEVRGSEVVNSGTLQLGADEITLRYRDYYGATLGVDRNGWQLYIVNSGSGNTDGWLVMDNVTDPNVGQLQYLRGDWPDFAELGSLSGLFTGHVTFTGSPGAGAISYGITHASALIVLASVYDNPTTAYASLVSVETIASFTIQFSTTANGAVDINFWNFRVPV